MIIPGLFMPAVIGRQDPVPFTTAWRSPSSFTTDTSGNFPWNDGANAYADDGSTAWCGSAAWDLNDASHKIRYAGFGFSTSDVPSVATINGIEVRVDCRNDNTGTRTLSSRGSLSASGSGFSGIAQRERLILTDSVYSDVTFGADDDTYGSPTPAQIVQADFGFIFWFSREATGGPQYSRLDIDHIEMRIHGVA